MRNTCGNILFKQVGSWTGIGKQQARRKVETGRTGRRLDPPALQLLPVQPQRQPRPQPQHRQNWERQRSGLSWRLVAVPGRSSTHRMGEVWLGSRRGIGGRAQQRGAASAAATSSSAAAST
eukprot:g13216.t1